MNYHWLLHSCLCLFTSNARDRQHGTWITALRKENNELSQTGPLVWQQKYIVLRVNSAHQTWTRIKNKTKNDKWWKSLCMRSEFIFWLQFFRYVWGLCASFDRNVLVFCLRHSTVLTNTTKKTQQKLNLQFFNTNESETVAVAHVQVLEKELEQLQQALVEQENEHKTQKAEWSKMKMKMESNEVQTTFQQQCLLNSNFKWMNDLQKEVKEAKQKVIELQNTLKNQRKEVETTNRLQDETVAKMGALLNKFVAQWSFVLPLMSVFFSLSPQQFDSSVKRLLATLHNTSEHNSNTKSQSWSSSRSLQPQLWQKMTNSELSKPSCRWLTNWQIRRQDWDWVLWKPTKTLFICKLLFALLIQFHFLTLVAKKKTKTDLIEFVFVFFVFCFDCLVKITLISSQS